MLSESNVTTRRTILAATLAPAILRAAPAPPIRIAFLGGAHPHGLGKAQVLLRNASFQLAGIYELDPAVLARFTRLGIISRTKEAILGDPTIQAIAVESHVRDHQTLAIEALNAALRLTAFADKASPISMSTSSIASSAASGCSLSSKA